MKTWKKRLLVFVAMLFCLGIFSYISKNFWFEQFQIYSLGKIEVAAQNFQNLPEDIDAVEIFMLSDRRDPKDTNGFAGDFEPIGTKEHKAITGADAKEIVSLWGQFLIGREFQAMCFEPVYGLQFKRKGEIYFQTSVCWECSGYTIPVSFLGTVHTVEYGFDSKSQGAQKLFERLQRLLPLPQKSEPKKAQI